MKQDGLGVLYGMYQRNYKMHTKLNCKTWREDHMGYGVRTWAGFLLSLGSVADPCEQGNEILVP